MDQMERITATGIVPVVVLAKAEDAIPAARALLAGGIDIMEITMRTEAALESIRLIRESAPDMLVGAGTVVNMEQCRACADSGASFIVSPGFDPEIVRWCIAKGLPVIPGCVSPSEIMEAQALGICTVKFFPANVYGELSAMKALSAPFGAVRFFPTGGIHADNIAEYFSDPYICAVGGSWMCSKADIEAGNFEKITALAAQARGIVRAVR